MAQRIHPNPPQNWPQCVVDLLDQVRRTRVGRALVRHVRRQTTFYAFDLSLGAQADVDPYLDEYGWGPPTSDLHVAARRVGCRALIRVKPDQTVIHNEGGLLRSPDISLAHELAHAVAITNGAYLVHTSPAYGAISREEAYAWMLENMYRREARYSIRNNYLENGATLHFSDPSDESTGILLRRLEQEAVEHFRRRVPALATELERIPAEACPYNPFLRHRVMGVPRRTQRSGAHRGR